MLKYIQVKGNRELSGTILRTGTAEKSAKTI